VTLPARRGDPRAPIRLLAILLAGCSSSNARILADLEERSARRPRPALDAAARAEPGPAPLLAPLREVELPMLGGVLPAVDGEIDGVRMPLLVDTGSSALALTGEAARRVGLHLPRGEARAIVAPGRDARARSGAVGEVRLGPLRFGPVQALVERRERPLEQDALRHDGAYAVVGCSILSLFRVTFDFRRRIVRLVPHAGAARAETLLVEARIRGRPFPLLVDSGATRLFLEPWASRELGTDPLTLEIGGRALPPIAPRTLRTFEGLGDASVRPAGLLGFAAFGDLVWTVDFSTRRLTVRGAGP